MKPKSFFSLVGIILLLFVSTTIAFGQSGIGWRANPYGVALSNATPGDTSTVTLRFIVGSGYALVKNDWLELKLTDFQINTTQAADSSKYTFSSVKQVDGDSIHMGTADFTLTVTDSTIRFNLVSDQSLIIDDSVTLVIANTVLRNKGKKTDVAVQIRSNRQPVYSTDTDTDALNGAQDAPLKTIALSDSQASQSVIVTITDTARGQIPKNGKLQIKIRKNLYGFTVTSANLTTSNVTVYNTTAADSVGISGVSVSNDSVITIQLNNEATIANKAQLVIQLGNSTTKGITNPTLYVTPDYLQSKTYNSASDIKVEGLDYNSYTIFTDSGNSVVTAKVVSNWFPADTGKGAVDLSDNTAGNITNLTLEFKLAHRVDSTSAMNRDTVVLHLPNFTINSDSARKDYLYSFATGGTFTDTTKFNAYSSGEYIYIIPTFNGYLNPNTPVRLTITKVLTNNGSTSDITIGLRTNLQTTIVNERDTTPIISNTGGIITRLALSDTNAGQPFRIDSLKFRTSGVIPSDGKIKIIFPTTFTLNSTIDTVRIDSAGSATSNYTRIAAKGGVASPTRGTATVTVASNVITIALNMPATIPSGTYLRVILGDSLPPPRQNYVGYNPTPAYAGLYPSSGKVGVVVQTLNSSDYVIQEGTNSLDTLKVRTNAFVDSFVTFVPVVKVSIATDPHLLTHHFNTTPDTAFAGDSIGLRIEFKLGSALTGKWVGGGSAYKKDTLFLALPDFDIHSVEAADTNNYQFISGSGDPRSNINFANWCSTAVVSSDTLMLIGHGRDTLFAGPDSTVRLVIRAQGALKGASPMLDPAGVLTTRGKRSKVRVSFWTNKQRQPAGFISLADNDSVRVVLPTKISQFAGIDTVISSDSLAGNTSIDTIRFFKRGILKAGYKVKVGLPSGFTFSSGIASSSVLRHQKLGIGGAVRTGTTTLSTTNTVNSALDTLTFTLASGQSDTSLTDTLVIGIGAAGGQGIVNIGADTFQNAASRRITFRKIKVSAYDSQDSLIVSNDSAFTSTLGINVGSKVVTSHIFSGGPIRLHSKGEDGIGTSYADTAGDVIDTLVVPFKLGQRLVGGNTITFRFSGAEVSSTLGATASLYNFKGDTGGIGKNGTQDFSVSRVNDTTVTITLATGDTLGRAYNPVPTPGRSADWKDTLLIVGVMRSLGARRTASGASGDTLLGNDLDVYISTSTQPAVVRDTTTNINYRISGATNGTGTLATQTAGSSPGTVTIKLLNRLDGGGYHGYFPAKGRLELIVPTINDTSQKRHEFTLLPNTFTTSNIAVSEGTTASATMTGATIDSSFNSLGVLRDSSKIGISFLNSSNTLAIEPDSTLTITFSAGWLNPRKANVAGPTDPFTGSIFASDGSFLTAYPFRLIIKDSRDMVISQNSGTFNAVNAGTADHILFMLSGQRYRPGESGSGRGRTSKPMVDTVNSGIPFAIAAVDQYNNLVTSATDNVNITTSTDNFAHIGDSNAVVGYNWKFASGKWISTSDSIRFLTAADSNTNLGRANKKHVLSATTGSISGTSDSIVVIPRLHGYNLVMFDGLETAQPGDTAARGKTSTSAVQLAKNGTYTVTVSAVDSFYNRTDRTVSEISTISASGGATLTKPTPISFNTTTKQYSFTLTATSISSGNTLTVTSVITSKTGLTYYDIVAATIAAQFVLDSTVTDLAGLRVSYEFKAAYSGNFGTGEGWSIWIHTDSGQVKMNASQGGTLVASGLTTGQGSTSLVSKDTTSDTRSLTESDTVFLYATLPFINDTVRGYSSRFVVRHQPILDVGTLPIAPDTGNVTLNSGTLAQTYNVKWKAVDYDNANIDVKLYIDTVATRSKDDITITSGAISALGTARRIASTTSLAKNDTMYTLNIISPDTVTRGTYTVYVAVYDGKNKNLAKSTKTITVKHSPSIYLDKPGAGLNIIDTQKQVKFPVYWGTTGAYDIDNTPTVAIYIDTVTNNFGTNKARLDTSQTKKQLTNGFSFSVVQTAKNTTDNSLFMISLDSLTSEQRPVSGGIYWVYALITDGVDTVMAQSPGQVKFLFQPKFTFLLNLGGALGKNASAAIGDDQVKLRKGDNFRFKFSTVAIAQTQYIRLIASQDGTSDYENFVFPPNASPTAWILNSSTGGAGTDVTTLTTSSTEFTWNTGNMSGITDGNYYIYAFVTNNSNNTESNWNNTNTERFTASGRLNLTGTDAVSTGNYSIYLSPNVVATTKDEIVTFDVKVNTKGQSAQEIAFFLDIPDSTFSVVDTNNDKKPFLYNSSYFFYSVTALEDTMITNAADTTVRLNFRKFRTSGGLPGTDTTVAQFQLKSRGTELVRVTEKNINFVQNTDQGRVTQMTNNGIPLSVSLPAPALRVRTAPLGRISGNIPLEGRTNFIKEITVELREIGSYIPITNTLFNTTNDKNATVGGVQVYTDNSGYYELFKVPTGTYNLVVKAKNYLSGQYPEIEVVPGDMKAGTNPTRDDAAIPNDHNELRGGDVSSGNAVGVQDNRVDSDDIQFLQIYFTRDTSTTSYGELGDINRNGKIDFPDLLIAAGNVSEEGVAPVFNKEAARDNSTARMKIEGIPEIVSAGREFEVVLTVQNVNDLKGYMFTLKYDKDMVSLADNGNVVVEGDFLYSGDGSARSVFFTKDDRKGTIFVSSLLGRVQTAQGTGELLRIKFKALADGPHPDITLTDVQLANSANQITSLGDVADVPTEFGLMQNYPNPFNPETRIRFQLPEASNVVLKVYNILGQEVRTLVNGKMTAGYHSMLWDGRNQSGLRVASGVYIYRIKAGKFTAVKKMVLLK